jgi:hypothetical protein
MADWAPLAQVAEFQGLTGQVTPPPVVTGSMPMQQPAAYPGSNVTVSIPNYLWQSIVVTLLCCLPFGVVSIVHAAKVDSLVAQGDIVAASAASQSAKKWAIAGVASWGALIALYILFFLVMMAFGTASASSSAAP